MRPNHTVWLCNMPLFLGHSIWCSREGPAETASLFPIPPLHCCCPEDSDPGNVYESVITHIILIYKLLMYPKPLPWWVDFECQTLPPNSSRHCESTPLTLIVHTMGSLIGISDSISWRLCTKLRRRTIAHCIAIRDEDSY